MSALFLNQSEAKNQRRSARVSLPAIGCGSQAFDSSFDSMIDLTRSLVIIMISAMVSLTQPEYKVEHCVRRKTYSYKSIHLERVLFQILTCQQRQPRLKHSPVSEANTVVNIGTVVIKMLHTSVTYPTMLCAQRPHQSTRVTKIFQWVLPSLRLPLFKEGNLGVRNQASCNNRQTTCSKKATECSRMQTSCISQF